MQNREVRQVDLWLLKLCAASNASAAKIKAFFQSQAIPTPPEFLFVCINEHNGKWLLNAEPLNLNQFEKRLKQIAEYIQHIISAEVGLVHDKENDHRLFGQGVFATEKEALEFNRKHPDYRNRKGLIVQVTYKNPAKFKDHPIQPSDIQSCDLVHPAEHKMFLGGIHSLTFKK